MSTTFKDLRQFMDASGLSYEADDEASIISVGFRCDPDDTTYRDEDGDPCVQLFVQLAEDGEFLAIFAPLAWNLDDCDHLPAVCEAVARIQSHMKLIRFDLGDDGLLRPNIEIPLERAPLCAEQLQRGIAGVLLAIRRFDPVIRRAMDIGEVDLTLARDSEQATLADPGTDSPPVPDVGRILDLANEAGGMDALDRLLGGDGAPPVGA
jgi:hypothetical protein